jgi:hypothetical protein
VVAVDAASAAGGGVAGAALERAGETLTIPLLMISRRVNGKPF